MRRTTTTLVAGSLALLLISEALAENTGNQSAVHEVYIPGLGDIMGMIQMRHTKLWFAGKRKNWQLAAYELDELKEGFGDAAKFQPDFKGHSVPQMVKENIYQPASNLEKAIESKNPIMFTKGFDQLTRACNACHQEAGFAFIVIKRPDILPFPNQQFEPQKHGD